MTEGIPSKRENNRLKLFKTCQVLYKVTTVVDSSNGLLNTSLVMCTINRKIKASRKGQCGINFGLNSTTRMTANCRVRHKKIGQCGSVNRIIMKLSSEYVIANRVLSMSPFISIQRGQTANCCCSKYLKVVTVYQQDA